MGSWGPCWGVLDRIRADKDIIDHRVHRKRCFIVNKSLMRSLENTRKRKKNATHSKALAWFTAILTLLT